MPWSPEEGMTLEAPWGHTLHWVRHPGDLDPLRLQAIRVPGPMSS